MTNQGLKGRRAFCNGGLVGFVILRDWGSTGLYYGFVGFTRCFRGFQGFGLSGAEETAALARPHAGASIFNQVAAEAFSGFPRSSIEIGRTLSLRGITRVSKRFELYRGLQLSVKFCATGTGFVRDCH